MGPDKIRHTDIAENEYDAIFDYLLKKHISVPKEDVPAIKKLLADNGQEYENIAIRRAYNLAIKIRNLDHDVLSTAEADNISNGLGTYNVSSATVERVFGWYRQWKSKQKVDKLEVVTPDKTSEVSVDLGKHFDDLYKTGVRLAKDMRSMCIDPKYSASPSSNHPCAGG